MTKRLVPAIVALASLLAASPAQAQGVHAADATTAPPMVTIVMSRSEISAADNMIGQEPAGTCTEDDQNITPLPWVLKWMATNTPRVKLTGSVETAATKASGYWCAHYGESIAPSWSQLQSFGKQYGMHFISHSADYPQVWTSAPKTWTGTLADWQNMETCGSRDAITAHGLLGADGEFFWPNSKTDPTVMADDVQQCFYMNRSYQPPTTFINTVASVEANQDIAYTRQLLGGSCSEVTDPSNSCQTPAAGCPTCLYTVPRQIITLINNLQPGQDLNLQAYVLVTNSNPNSLGQNQYKTNADQWDCTNPDPAYHWTNDAERYCFADFQRIVMAIQNNPNVVVTDPEGVAVAWGMTPPTR